MKNNGTITLGIGTRTRAELEEHINRIRELNDQFRTTGKGGCFITTQRVVDLGPSAVQRIITILQTFHYYIADDQWNDEHHFGSFSLLIDGDDCHHRIDWQIHYYDENQKFASVDPSDPEKTTRVMMITLAPGT